MGRSVAALCSLFLMYSLSAGAQEMPAQQPQAWPVQTETRPAQIESSEPSVTAPLAGPTVLAAATPAPRLPVGPQIASYRVGAGDQIRITVFGEPELTGDYLVGAQGAIAFALIGDIPVGGLRTTEIAAEVTRRLQDGFLRDPRVSVAVIAYRPFFILGEVQRPGAYPFAPDLSIAAAVATAGGFSYRANRRTVFVSAAGGGRERRVPLNANTHVQPGDTIRIGERWF